MLNGCWYAAAAAKSLQSCPTLCDPIDGSPPGSPIPGILQARTLELGCYFLLKCMKVKSESEVAQSCPTVSNPMDCSLPGSSVHGIFQARVLEWGAIAFSGCWYRQAQLHHKWYVYSSPDHFLTFCPRSQCNVFFFFLNLSACHKALPSLQSPALALRA